jgi:hypothetical protein
MLNDAIPSQQRATVISLQSLVAMAGLGIVQLAFFAIGERTTIATAIGVCGLLMVVLATPILAILSRPGAKTPETASVMVADTA